MIFLSGMSRPANAARPLHQRDNKSVPMCAAKPSNGTAPKARRTRKSSSSSPTVTEDGVVLPSAGTGFGTPIAAAAGDRSLHRLHGTSETLRALLERRAERQKQHIESSPAVPLTTRTENEPLSTTAATTAATSAQKNKVKVRFWLQFRVEFGQSIIVVGGSPDLGNWVLADGVPLGWSEGDMWNATVDIPAGTVTEYKYVVVGQGGHAAAWQQGNNSVLALRQSDDVVEVYDNWGGNPGAQVLVSGLAPMTRESRLLSWANELEAQVAGQRQELRRARMELVAAQEEARVAREESKKLKMALAKSETDRIAAVANLKQAETVNQILQTQLKETTISFSTALETAMELLTPKPKGTTRSRGKKAATEKAQIAATDDTSSTTTTSTTATGDNSKNSSTTTSTTPEVDKVKSAASSSTRRI
ncbi:hypothetical protein NADE_008513 [Nannochloris sp. 'desiccata']|nr:hypothetical protein NADE_008513 [Chlorella desiccata (nom. nud.)]